MRSINLQYIMAEFPEFPEITDKVIERKRKSLEKTLP